MSHDLGQVFVQNGLIELFLELVFYNSIILDFFIIFCYSWFLPFFLYDTLPESKVTNEYIKWIQIYSSYYTFPVPKEQIK
jgi:hypothetical protein